MKKKKKKEGHKRGYPEHFRYTKDHEWIEVMEDGVARIGITDYAQSELGDVVFVELPSVGDTFEQSETFGTIESVKAVADLHIPVGGTVKEVNTELANQPEVVNQAPHDDGWMIHIEMTDEEEFSTLMSAEEYEEFISGLEEESRGKGGDEDDEEVQTEEDELGTGYTEENTEEEPGDGESGEESQGEGAGGGRSRRRGGSSRAQSGLEE